MTPFLKQHDPRSICICSVGLKAGAVAHHAFPFGNLTGEWFEKIANEACAPLAKTIREMGGAEVDVQVAANMACSAMWAHYLELCEELDSRRGCA